MHPEDRQQFVSAQKTSMKAMQDIDLKYRIILPDGLVKWVHEIGKVIKNESWNAAIFHGTVQDITAQKLLSLSLEESNQRYSLVSQATSDAIWDWDLEKNTLYWGEGFEKIFGHDSSDSYSPIRSWADFLHPEDKTKTIDGIYSVIGGTDTNWKDEYRYLKSDGTYAYVVDRGFVIRDSIGIATRMVGAMHDITKHQQEEQWLKLLESVVVNTNDAILITEAEPFDEPGPRIVYVNQAFTRMTGYTAEEFIGKTPRILQGPKSDKKELKRLSETIRNWQSCEVTTINYKKSGEEFWINFSVTPIADETGWFTHWITVARDVSQQKNADEELKLFADELFKRNKELQQFGYVISHNLRSPVANIMGITDLLLMGKDDPETFEHCAKNLKIAVTSLDGVIKDLGKVLSATDGSAALIQEPVNFRELIENIQIDLAKAIEHSGVKIRYSGDLIVYHSSKAYLYSIFFNLISNAIKYRSAHVPHVIISAQNTEEGLIIQVADNGIGIDLEKHKDEIFKPYKRFETKAEGKGLGLFLVKSHVEALNGTLSLESELDRGTTFTICLPPN
ncbi:PAS domain-containing protein [Pedobacter sp. JCM 36344]|uniref:PAS domain-containing sensor histidine kinase n=1 Tax=Pedobacter sp. JCM 36344 TaxID=3374280 RepID=UPI00397A6CF4